MQIIYVLNIKFGDNYLCFIPKKNWFFKMIVWLYYFFNFHYTKPGQYNQHIKIYMCETSKYRPQNT